MNREGLYMYICQFSVIITCVPHWVHINIRTWLNDGCRSYSIALGTAMHREESVDANDANFLLKAPASPQCQQRSCWRSKTDWTKLHLQRRKKESSENLKRDLRFSFKIDPTSWKFQNSNVLHLQQKLHFWWDVSGKLCRIWTQILYVGKERRFGFSELWIQIMCRKSCRFCFLELLASSVTKSLWWGIPKTVLVQFFVFIRVRINVQSPSKVSCATQS